MPYPSTLDTRVVTVGVPRTIIGWDGVDAEVTLTPLLPITLDLAGGAPVLPVKAVLRLDEENGWAGQVEVVASDSRGISTTGFDYQVAWRFPGRDLTIKPFRVRVPRWTGAGPAPALDLDVVLPVVTPGSPVTNIPFVTPDALEQRIAGIEAGDVDLSGLVTTQQLALKADDADLDALATEVGKKATNASVTTLTEAVDGKLSKAQGDELYAPKGSTGGGSGSSAPSGSAGGFLSGMYPSPGVNSGALDAAVAARITAPTSETRVALVAGFVPRWQASTAYGVGALVVAPTGEIVRATTAHTSAATYNSSSWAVTAGASGSNAGASTIAGVSGLEAALDARPIATTDGDELTLTIGGVGHVLSPVQDGMPIGIDGDEGRVPVWVGPSPYDYELRAPAVAATATPHPTNTHLLVLSVGTSDVTPPSIPATPTATAGVTSASATTPGSTDAVGVVAYRWYRAGTLIATTSGRTLTETGLAAGVAIAYTVAAVDAAGNVSAPSQPSNSVTPQAPAAAPVAGKATVTATGDTGKVTLAGSAANATSYTVFRSTTSGAVSAKTSIASGVTLPYDDTTGTTGTRYYYQVRASNGTVASSEVSDEVSAIVGGAATQVPAKATITATGGPDKVTVAGTATGATSYVIYRGTTSGLSGTKVLVASNVSLPWDDGDVVSGTTYYYQARGRNAVGDSVDASAEVAAAPDASASLPGRAVVTATGAPAKITIEGPAPGATSYRIIRSESSGASSAKGTIASNVTLPWVDTSGTAGQTYYYQVKGVNAAGESEVFSTEVNAVLGPDESIRPGVTTITAAPGAGRVTISGSAPGASTFQILRATFSGTSGSKTQVASGVALPWVDTNVTAGTTYYYQARGVNGTGTSAAASSQVSGTPT